MNSEIILSEEFVVKKIYHIRGKRLMMDHDLAEMYGIETKRLKEQVRRNFERFPLDFILNYFRTSCSN